MALNNTGPISLAGATAGESIAVELGQSATGTIALNDANVRTLAGVPTGAIVMPTNFYGKSNTVAFGEQSYTTAGTYTFTVPSGVTEICAVAVAGGCGQNSSGGINSRWGGGGALSYSNGIPTTPGESLTVFVGAGGLGPSATPSTGGQPSYISRGGTTLLSASAAVVTIGYANGVGGAASTGIGAVRYSGGANGTGAANFYIGCGGGGAAGYAGDGGQGGDEQLGSGGSPGSGGGAGGGGSNNNATASGGGVGIVVQGASGAGGTYPGIQPLGAGGGGSGGTPGLSGATPGPGGSYGGGGRAHGDPNTLATSGGPGGGGAVRIIYGGTGKTYPNNSAP
jgi:hypothetical protein